MNRAGRYNQILMAFSLRVQRGMGNEMTSYEIAKQIDLRPTSPNFRAILSEMVRDGKLKCRAVDSKKGGEVRGTMFMYRPTFDEMLKTRRVEVKKNGKQVGQLELF